MTRTIARLGGLVSLVGLAACTFQGGGLAPFTPTPTAPAETDLEVPYVTTPRPVVAAMLDMAAVGPDDYLIDLGSGDGRIAIMAAQRGARALGVDLDPQRVSQAAAAAAFAQVQDRARFRRQDLFATPLLDADVVTLYLLPEVNLRLRPRLLTELRPGARVVSHNFTMGDWRPDESRELGSSRIHLWIVPAPAEGRWAMEGVATGLLRLEQRFQELSGSLEGRPLRDVTLRGRQLTFTVDLPGETRTFRAIVGDAEMVPDPDAGEAAAWRARRVG
ncbi:class I SAM-dependent methyltransferase [Sphingosinicella sp. CPCC 101087]|uniref:class I SAM-dependent methyltransferase n=1 Tax=Sphingosinicella sp. CPCC 101087 TaxID=2497754 RepID=UPI00101DED06|nr:class I SAM-dependent methyltransferase [Sphingosinicella sp. CPCC 101087]